MSLVVAPETPVFAVGETNNLTVSFADILDDGELLAGTPVAVELTSNDLTIDNKRLNTSVVVIGDHAIAIGKAVQFRVAGQNDDTSYTVRITVATDSSPSQVKVRGVSFTGEAVA